MILRIFLLLLLLGQSILAEKRKVLRSTVLPVNQMPVFAEGGVPMEQLSLNIETESEAGGTVENLELSLERSHVLLIPDDPDAYEMQTFRGFFKDQLGRIIGWAALTFDDVERKRYSGIISDSSNNHNVITEQMIDELPKKAGIKCGTEFHEHATVPLMFGGSAAVREGEEEGALFGFDIFGAKEKKDGDDEHHDDPSLSCFHSRHYIYLGVAADCEFIKRLGGRQKAKAHIIKTYNEVSGMYERAFNVAVGIVELVLPKDSECADPAWLRENAETWNGSCLPTNSLGPLLSEFTRWRASARKDDEAGLWHLLTGCKVDGSEVGLGWIDTLGVRHIRGSRPLQRHVGGTAVSTLDGASLIQVIAHELGHNLGACHDCAKRCSCVGIACRECCPCASPSSTCDCRGQFLMNPTTNMASLDFSPCTRRQICSALRLRPNHIHPQQVALQRLSKSPLTLFAVCGNGVREPGEECDCGTPEECAVDPCCMEGCKLRPGAFCSAKNSACCHDCKVITDRTRVCRKSRGPCDLEERCNGRSPDCPPDRHLPDGTDCTDNSNDSSQLHCASGVCTNRDSQCRSGAARFHAQHYCQSTALSSSCFLHCAVPVVKSSGRRALQLTMTGETECMQLSSMLIDGTRCGERGHCRQGICVEGGVWEAHRLATLILAFPLLALVFGIALYMR